MTSWWNIKLTKWHVDEMTCWQNDILTKWHDDKTTSWWNYKLTKWHVHKMACWQNDLLTKCPGTNKLAKFYFGVRVNLKCPRKTFLKVWLMQYSPLGATTFDTPAFRVTPVCIIATLSITLFRV